MSRSVRGLFIFCICISACLFIFSASQPLPYLHPDEHFQIVEFASYKMGITPAADLAWEFNARIRPAFQPYLCFHIFNGLNAIGLRDHYAHLFVLRLLTALLTLFAMSLFCYSNLRSFSERHQRWYVGFTFLFWVTYSFGTRFASEAWSGDLTLIAFSLILLFYEGRLKRKSLAFFTAGLFFGMAFLCRFHTAFFAMAIMLWMLFVKKEKLASGFIILAGVFAVVGLGTCIDHWFYDEWICTPWAYFDSAFIHQRADFGTSPFYLYALILLDFLSPPIGILVFISLIVLLLRQPRGLYAWVVLLFLLVHSLIPHKEPRFLYPVYFFLPVLVMSAISYMSDRGWFIAWSHGRKLAIWLSLISFNFLFLLIFVLLADYIGFDAKIFSPQIHELAKKGPVDIYYKDGNADPYILPNANIAKDLYPEYLRDSNVHDLQVNSFCGLKKDALIASSLYDFKKDSCYQDNIYACQIIGHTAPLWWGYLPLGQCCGVNIQDEIDRNIYLLYRHQ